MPDANFGKTLFSVPVIIGGVAIGAFLLLTGNKGGQSTTAGPSPAVISATVQMNAQAAQSQVQLAQIAAQSGAAQLNADNVRTGQILSYLTNVSNNNASIINQRTQSAGKASHCDFTQHHAYNR